MNPDNGNSRDEGRRPSLSPGETHRLHLTRRQFLSLAAGAALLVACGDNDEPDAATSSASTTGAEPTATIAATSAPQPTPTPAEAPAFPVTIEHKLGSTTIESEPERVVSVGFQEHDTLLALGVTPVAVRDWWNDQPFATWVWAREALGDAEPVVLPSGELELEVIAGLTPDVIIGPYGGITEDEYNVLSQIAPTVPQPAEYADYTMPWREQTLLIGKVLGKEAQAQALIDEVDAKFAATAEAHPQFEGKTFVIGGPNDDSTYWIYGVGDPRSRLMADLGFDMPAGLVAEAGDEFYATLSAEKANLMDTDVFIALVETEADIGIFDSDPVFQQLNVVKEGRVIYIAWDSDLAGALSFTSVLSLPYALEQLTPLLTDALDG